MQGTNQDNKWEKQNLEQIMLIIFTKKNFLCAVIKHKFGTEYFIDKQSLSITKTKLHKKSYTYVKLNLIS